MTSPNTSLMCHSISSSKNYRTLPVSAYANEPLIRKQLLLAHQIQEMLAEGRAKDLQQIAGWLNLTKARLEQITNLLFLCPKIQEDLICLEPARLSDISERTIRFISSEIDWQKQVTDWNKILPSARG